MKQIAHKARRKANAEDRTDPRAQARPSGAIELTAPSAIPEADAKDAAAMRWGRHVVEHFRPQEGDLILIKGPPGEKGREKRERMSHAIEELIQEQGIDDYLILRGPSHQLVLSQISDDRLRELGYRRTGEPSFDTPSD